MTTPDALTKAILARLRGSETLTGEAETAREILKGHVPRWRFGTLSQSGELPHGNVFADAGVDAMPNAPDVGIINHSVRRFELWTEETASAFFTQSADALEKLFDERRGAPDLTVEGDGRVYQSSLFVPFQGPFRSDDIRAWWGVISFTFVDARP